MNTKIFEVRDRGTFMPVLAIEMTSPYNVKEHYLLNRAGYSLFRPLYLVSIIEGFPHSEHDLYEWAKTGARTMQIAHQHIEKNFHYMSSGDVIDVEYILGETSIQKLSEIIESEQNPFLLECSNEAL